MPSGGGTSEAGPGSHRGLGAVSGSDTYRAGAPGDRASRLPRCDLPPAVGDGTFASATLKGQRRRATAPAYPRPGRRSRGARRAASPDPGDSTSLTFPCRSPRWASRPRSPRSSPDSASPTRRRSRPPRCPTPSPAGTCSAADAPAAARPSRSACRCSRRWPAATRRTRRSRPARWSCCPTRELAGQVARRARPAHRGPRPRADRRLRRRGPAAPGAGAAPRRRPAHRLPRPARGPHRPGPGRPRPRRGHRARRGRPHVRPRLPARRPAPAAPHARGLAAPAVLRHARRRGRPHRAASSCTSR